MTRIRVTCEFTVEGPVGNPFAFARDVINAGWTPGLRVLSADVVDEDLVLAAARDVATTTAERITEAMREAAAVKERKPC